MAIGNLTQQSMEALEKSFKGAFGNPLNGDALKKGNMESINFGNGNLTPELTSFLDELQKAGITVSTGLVGYNLSDVVTNVNTYFPADNHLSNSITRNKGKFDKARFKVITGSNKGPSSAPEGGRGTATTPNLTEYDFDYKTTAHNFNYTLQAQLAGQGFKDPAQVASMNATFELRRSEELKFLGGNQVAYGNTGLKPTLGAGTGGTISAGNWSVKIAALGVEALNSAFIGDGTSANNSQGNNIGKAPQNTQVANLQLVPVQTYSGSSNSYTVSTSAYWNVGIIGTSTVQAISTAGNGSLTASWSTIAGAAGYAVFAGAAGAETLQMISTNNACKLTSIVAGGCAFPSADGSADTNSYLGLIPQIIAGGVNGGNYIDAGNAKLTHSGGLALEINNLLDYIYGTTQQLPDIAYVSPQTLNDISTINLSYGAVYNYVGPNPEDKLQAVAGLRTLNYLHKASGRFVKLISHVYMPQGSALFLNTQLQALTDAPFAIEFQYLTDYMQLNYAVTSQQYNADVLNIGALIMRYPKSSGLIYNLESGVQ